MPPLHETTARPEPELGAYRDWRPEAQERALEALERRKARPWRPFYCRQPQCNGQPHVRANDKRECAARFGHEWEYEAAWVCNECGVEGTPVDSWLWRHARWDQHPPRWRDDWLTWFMSGGRGSGKTRAGSEVSHRASEMYPYLIFIAPTGPDFRETMIEGESGILATAHPDRVPEFEASKKKLTWPNGAIALGFSAEEPDRLRGKQSGFVWADEPAHYPSPDEVWSNMEFGHRLEGKKKLQPKVVMTSTPKPTTFVKEKIAEEDCVTVRVSSYANSSNLAENYKKKVLKKHEGTRLGRQELEGEVLADVEGALWSWDYFVWLAKAPALRRIVVAVDPAGTANKRSDLTGIIVLGIGFDNAIYVLDDQSGKYSPAQWADRVVAAYDFWKADAVVVEKTYGRDMVTHTLQNSRYGKSLMPRIIDVDSRRGKEIRAEPVVAIYEKNWTTNKKDERVRAPLRIAHVGERGALGELEDEQTTWIPGEGSSPNRVDALVHGCVELAGPDAEPVEVATPLTLTQDAGEAFPSTPSGILVPSHPMCSSFGDNGNPYGLYVP